MWSRLYELASEDKTLEEQELIAEALCLLQGASQYTSIKDMHELLTWLERIIEYRTFKWQRETHCLEPSLKIWVTIHKAFSKLKEEYENY